METDDLLLFYVELNKAARPLWELRAKLKASPSHVLSPEERAQVYGEATSTVSRKDVSDQ